MNFLNGSLRIGRLFGISVRVHVLFLLWIGFRLFDAAGQGVNWTTELLFLAMLFGIVLLHEFGHCLGARAVGGHAEDILMWPLGGLAYAHAPMRPWPQFVTVASGPAVNVLFCLLSAAVMFIAAGGQLRLSINPLGGPIDYLGAGPLPAWFVYVAIFYRVNLFLLAFNLLPIYPLDGGQLFQAVLWPFVGLHRATLIACQVGLVGCGVLGLLALRGGGGGMLFFIAIFGGFTCWQRLQALRHGYIQEDSRFEAFYSPSRDPRPWYQRLFRTGPRRRSPSAPIEFPGRGAWEARQQQRAEEEAELDRLLKKVSEHGIQSLSYVDRQRLEQITRRRRQEEEQLQRGPHV